VCQCASNNSAPTVRIFVKFDVWVGYFSKVCVENSNFIKTDENDRYFTWRRLYVYDHISRISRIKNVPNKMRRQKTHFVFSNCFRKSCRSWDKVEKYCRARLATDDNVAHAQCMLDTKGYKHTLRICNIYCFWTATVVTRTSFYCVYTYITCLVNLTIPSVTHGRSLACSIRRSDDCGSGAVGSWCVLC